jgi:uncharacterized glyoxalase superfamily protein PhnB
VTGDPFDALRLPVAPVDPRPEFAADLRSRLARALGTDPDPSPGGTVMSTTEPAVRRATLAPYLAVSDARAAIRYYTEAFGATVEGPVFTADDGRIGHAELRIGDATVMLADPWEVPGVDNPTALGATTVQLHLTVGDVDGTYQRAVAAGGTGTRPPADQDYGDRAAQVADPFGHYWMLNQPGRALGRDELSDRMEPGGFSLEDVDLGDRATAPSPASPADVASLYYFTLNSPDTTRSQAFFGELLGWRFGDGGHIVNTAPPGGVGDAEEPRIDLYFKVADFRSAVARVRELGGQADEPVHWPSGWAATCRDPEGVPFHLSEPAPGYE